MKQPQSRHKIPQMFYLRKINITVQVLVQGVYTRTVKTMHVFWNYRNPTLHFIDTDDRGLAKEAIITGLLQVKVGRKWEHISVCKANPDAEFYR